MHVYVCICVFIHAFTDLRITYIYIYTCTYTCWVSPLTGTAITKDHCRHIRILRCSYEGTATARYIQQNKYICTYTYIQWNPHTLYIHIYCHIYITIYIYIYVSIYHIEPNKPDRSSPRSSSRPWPRSSGSFPGRRWRGRGRALGGTKRPPTTL